MKLLYIVNYNLSFLFREIPFSQRTNAFVLYVFCMTNQYKKDIAEYYSSQRFFPPMIFRNEAFSCQQKKGDTCFSSVPVLFGWPHGKVLGQCLIQLS